MTLLTNVIPLLARFTFSAADAPPDSKIELCIKSSFKDRYNCVQEEYEKEWRGVDLGYILLYLARIRLSSF